MSKGTFGFGLVLGALAGAASAYLFAPKSGEELQADLASRADEAKKKAILALDEAVTEAEIWVDNKLAEKEFGNEPIVYARTEDTVAATPEGTVLEEKDPVLP
jgi:gas vesicle protein